ncbi:uncharacterized protein J4E78_001955 [Alternaria triticimaculans]|uniref:uncharacterized protein n=1 Tax=Alternaria triticimaculans TaxID=297637 RepID=UPI0020C3F946|nr:uncharacterized protein J4E78_001955 [Alternaria triticimaculans]KAI4668132.1 hypothetical protein J4E78_001955 [Alternaria triticimaculans]
MLRRFIFHTLVFPPAQLPAVRRIIHCRGHSSSATGDEVQAARAWLAELHAETIPFKSIGELSFSRSSGPGGQNVNKVNSKATSNAIIVQADDSRKQSDNAQSCYRRIYQAIARAGQDAVPAETSAAQVQRVKQLQKADNERRLKSKKQQSAKKTSRRSRGDE